MANHPSPQQWILEWLSKQSVNTPFLIERLLGDGSSRTFYRVRFQDESYILLEDKDWIQTKDYPPHQKFLIQLDLPVPHFLSVDQKNGFLLMEDLGDELLQNRILRVPEQKIEWLKQAVALLAHLHGKSYPVPSDLPVSERSFDSQKYFDEFLFTIEHLHSKYLNLPSISSEAKLSLNLFCQKISSFTPKVFCHRDFHTRNIIVNEEKLFLIDFQDARMGSPHYDLSSILYDAYLPLNQGEREALYQVYENQLSLYPLHKSINWKNFISELKQVAFQRTIKAAGSFASFYTRYQKKTHLQYINPALSSALELQKTCPELEKEVKSIFNLSQWIKITSEKE